MRTVFLVRTHFSDKLEAISKGLQPYIASELIDTSRARFYKNTRMNQRIQKVVSLKINSHDHVQIESLKEVRKKHI